MSPGINDEAHVANGLVEGVEAALGDELPDCLVCDLVAPLIDMRHAEIVDEEHHTLPARRAICSALPFLCACLQPCKLIANIRAIGVNSTAQWEPGMCR